MAQETQRVGFLGLGAMGAPMAERLFGEGIELHVFDPRPEAMASFATRGAITHASPRDLADAATIVLACLPTGPVSEAAALGPDGVVHGRAIRIHAEMSTIGRPTAERIGEGLAARVWRFGLAHGAAGQDIAEYARQIEAWAGAEIRSRKEG